MEKENIPKYKLENFRPVHRLHSALTDFGYNKINQALHIKGFEIYSTEGLTGAFGPLKSEFYRIGFTLSGTVEVELGLEKFLHQAATINFTFPNQIFSKYNLSDDFFGYYLLFDSQFLNDLIPSNNIATDFPFFAYSGVPFFSLSQDELSIIENLFFKINDELHLNKSGKIRAIQMYSYLILLECKRSYDRQKLGQFEEHFDNHRLVTQFRRLVSEHFLEKRQVADYAKLLSVTPNHLNKTIKNSTNETASDIITNMLLLEAKALLKDTELSISEISYQLNFSEPAAFNRFFKKETLKTPLHFRQKA